MQEVKLKQTGSNDIETIAKLAYVIWNQHYPAIIGQQQVDYMLSLMYSSSGLREQMEVKHHRFYLIEVANENSGFISVNEEKEGEWFLNKFYVDQTRAGKGIGTKVFELIKEFLKPSKVTLTVNRGNYKTINFYFKLGFVIEKTAVFDIGNGYTMDDFIMTWKK